MPASPITKVFKESPDIYPHLEKVIIPDQATGSYWSVWYSLKEVIDCDYHIVDVSLMWCPIGDNPSINDNWGHAEEIDESCKGVLDAIEAVYGISFHSHIFTELEDDPIS